MTPKNLASAPISEVLEQALNPAISPAERSEWIKRWASFPPEEQAKAWLAKDPSWTARVLRKEPWVSVGVGVLLATLMAVGRQPSWYASHTWWEIAGTALVLMGICMGVVRSIVETVKGLRCPPFKLLTGSSTPEQA